MAIEHIRNVAMAIEHSEEQLCVDAVMAIEQCGIASAKFGYGY